jgi:hypothetical protein
VADCACLVLHCGDNAFDLVVTAGQGPASEEIRAGGGLVELVAAVVIATKWTYLMVIPRSDAILPAEASAMAVSPSALASWTV